jgi:hypothetical protein
MTTLRPIQDWLTKTTEEIGRAWADAQEHICARYVASGASLRGRTLVFQKFDDTSFFPARPTIECWVAPAGNHMPKRYPLARQTLWAEGWRVEIVEAPPSSRGDKAP